MYRQFTDGTYTRLVPRPEWLGYLGPILRAEVGDTIVVYLKNFATRNYSMHPHGVFYEKDAEGVCLHVHCINECIYSTDYVCRRSILSLKSGFN